MNKKVPPRNPVMPPAKRHSGVLFRFVQYVLAQSAPASSSDMIILDSDVGATIYPGYPYVPYWKRGQKDVGRALEMDLLARALGIPLQWIVEILDGSLSLEQAQKRWNDKFAAPSSTEHIYLRQTDVRGSIEAIVSIEDGDYEYNAILSEKIQAFVDKELQK